VAIHNLNLTLKKPFILICLFGQDDVFEFALEFCACLMPALIAAQLTPLIFNNEFFIANLILPPQ
jgi:hypothetical protein